MHFGWPLVLVALLVNTAMAQPMARQQVPVIGSLQDAVFVASPPNDVTRLFFVKRIGRVGVYKLDTGQVVPGGGLVIAVNGRGEGGLLGLAFHPQFDQNQFFYVFYTTATDRVIARYRMSAANPDVPDPASATIVLRFNDGGTANHIGGWIGFGPDGYLYISSGHAASDAGDTNHLLGKILRLDVNGPDMTPGTLDDDAFPTNANKNYCVPATNPFVGTAGEDEIWSYGLRNPFRCSFDRETGDFWIGDTGSLREEVDYAPAGQGGGWNYGFPCRDGDICVGSGCCSIPSTQFIEPIHVYQRVPSQSAAVIGGYVYRGCALPSLRGRYVFADYSKNKIWSFKQVNGMATDFRDHTPELQPPSIVGFGEDATGELYFYGFWGVFRIVPATPDCNGNGQPDGCEIVAGTAPDVNNNSIIDSCEQPWPCHADYNQDGDFGTDADIEDFFACLAGNCCTPCGSADFNGDGDTGTDADIEAFFRVLAGQPC